MPPSAPDDPETLVSTGWLADRLGDPDLRILDGSWHMPGTGRDARAEYEAAHIPGAAFFDIDALSDRDSALPHMAPSPETFASALAALGIGDGDRIVIYDTMGVFFCPACVVDVPEDGVQAVSVLDGGLPKWLADGHVTDTRVPMARDRSVSVDPVARLVADAAEVAQASAGGAAQILDARAAPRFHGEVAEPRPGLRAGHIPNALNLPFANLLHPDGTMKDADALRTAFVQAGTDLSRPVITTCGSGITAAILILALERIGHRDHALYDGSWAEWGGRDDLPIAKG